MATRKTTKKPPRRQTHAELLKAQITDPKWQKWFKENQERLGLDPHVLRQPGWAISSRTKQPEVEHKKYKYIPSEYAKEQRRKRDERRKRDAAKPSKKERQARAAASGESLVADLPTEFAGQITETLGGCWKRHGSVPNKRESRVYHKLFAALREPVETGKLLHHRCENGWCVNPWHIEQMFQDVHKREHEDLRFRWLVFDRIGRRDVA